MIIPDLMGMIYLIWYDRYHANAFYDATYDGILSR